MNWKPVLAIALLAVGLPSQGPGKGTRLVYEMPVDAVQRALHGRSDEDLESVLADAVSAVRARLGEDAAVMRSSATQFTVEVGLTDKPSIAQLRRRIEARGQLEIRAVAAADYLAPETRKSKAVKFDLELERQRLQAWLSSGGREKLARSSSAIDEFHASNVGPAAGESLRWFVHRVEPDRVEAGRWSFSLARSGAELGASVVAVFDDKDWNDGLIPAHMQKLPAHKRFLVELVALNMHERFFSGGDLDAGKSSVAVDERGCPTVAYKVQGDRCLEYADWTEKYIGHNIALVWEGEVQSAPRILSRITGSGLLTGSEAFPAEVILGALRNPMLCSPRLVRIEAR